MQCVTWLLVFAFAVFVMMSLLRWFEQTADAVDERRWDKVALLVAIPFSAWLYRSKIGAGRPTVVPHHDPVRGFGPLPKEKPVVTDGPPPGTPKEFLGMPAVPPKGSRPNRPPVDPEKLARLKQKMREQGMLPDGDDAPGA